MHKAGKCLVYEVDDDHFSDAFVRHLAITEWTKAEEGQIARGNVTDALKHCDGVTVSTPHLASLVREKTDKPVQVVPNAIDLHWWRAVLAKALRLDPHLTIGWIGARRPEQDFQAMLEAWGKLAPRHPDVRFLVAGYQPKALRDYVKEPQLLTLPWFDLEEYPLSFKSVDIGCCTLSDTAFNRCKSNIKVQEYGASAAAVVASPTVYATKAHGFREGRECLFAETAPEWESALERLITDERLRKRLMRNLRRKVERELCLDVNLWRWPAAWEAIHQDYTLRKARSKLVVARY